MAEEEAKQRIGIMGGTFDPIHNAHLMIAEAVRESFQLDRVLFIPAAQPPHKQGRMLASAYHRLMMVQLAVSSNPSFQVSRQELQRPGPSYSLLTLQELQDQYGPQAEFYFITDSDTINELHTWYHTEELLQRCHFVGTTRPGTPVDMTELEQRFGQLAQDKIHLLTVPRLEISSTAIRQRLRTGRSVRYLIPQAVGDYIKKEGLYQCTLP